VRIGIQTSGSDGDIVPFFSSANGLRTAGHDVTVCYISVDRTDYSGLADTFDVTPINEKAKCLSAMMKKEHGVGMAVKLIEHTFQKGRPYV